MQLCLVLIFLAALLINVCEANSAVCAMFGLGSDGEGVFLFFLIFTTAVLLMSLLIGAWQIIFEMRQFMNVLRLKATGEVVVVTRDRGVTPSRSRRRECACSG